MRKILGILVLILAIFAMTACDDDNYFFPEASGALGVQMMKGELEDAGYSFDVLEWDECDVRESQINTDFSLSVVVQTMFVATGNNFIELINFDDVQEVADVVAAIDSSSTINWLYFEEGGDTLVITDNQAVIDILVAAHNAITTTTTTT